jgi:hypothetical protein
MKHTYRAPRFSIEVSGARTVNEGLTAIVKFVDQLREKNDLQDRPSDSRHSIDISS